MVRVGRIVRNRRAPYVDSGLRTSIGPLKLLMSSPLRYPRIENKAKGSVTSWHAMHADTPLPYRSSEVDISSHDPIPPFLNAPQVPGPRGWWGSGRPCCRFSFCFLYESLQA